LKNKIKFIIIPIIIATAATLLTISLSGKPENNAASNSHGVNWHPLKQGLETAGKVKKPVLFFFYTEWCTYCTKMDNEIFTDPEIVSYLNSKFISIRVNPEKETEKVRVMKEKITPMELLKYSGGRGFPTTIFWDRQGKPVTSVPGYLEKKVFLPLLRYMNSSCYNKKVKFMDYLKNSSLCQKI